MTIVNMVGGGGDPEVRSLTLPVLNGKTSYRQASSSSATNYASIYSTTNTIETGTVKAYPEQKTARVSVNPSVDHTDQGSYKANYYTYRVKVIFSASDKSYLDAIYDALGGGFYMACSTYARNTNGRNMYPGDPTVVSYYTKGLSEVYVTITYTGPEVDNYYLLPEGVYR